MKWLLVTGLLLTLTAPVDVFAQRVKAADAGRTVLLSGDIDSALDIYAQALNKNTKPETRLDYAYVLALHGLYDVSAVYLDEARQLGADPRLVVWYASRIVRLMGYPKLAEDMASSPHKLALWLDPQADRLQERFGRAAPEHQTPLSGELVQRRYKAAKEHVTQRRPYQGMFSLLEVMAATYGHPAPRMAYSMALEKAGLYHAESVQMERVVEDTQSRKPRANVETLLNRRNRLQTLHATSTNPTAPKKGRQTTLLFFGGRYFAADGIASGGASARLSIVGSERNNGGIDIGYNYTSVRDPISGDKIESTSFTLGVTGRNLTKNSNEKFQFFYSYGVRATFAEPFQAGYSAGIGFSLRLSERMSLDLASELTLNQIIDAEINADPTFGMTVVTGITTYFGSR